MSHTFLRFGLWIILLVLALYVVRETFGANAGGEFITDDILKKSAAFGVILLSAGIVSWVLEKVFSKVKLRHCALCSQSVAKGEIYCRTHLRQLLEREDTINRRSRVR